ncbi:MAG: phenylacetate--CoA ligase family protein [Deltaproteobacteria bacterium]|nr:phenylacetate--CoA ligase family protein [Deltaproteobacteria bacterium]
MSRTLSRLAWRASVAIRREDVPGHLRRLEESQWWDAARLEEHRITALRGLLEHAARTVPAQAERFAAAAFRPGDLSRAEDLRRLPVMEKDDLRRAWEDFVSREPGDRVTRDHTSGSTGHPLVYAKTRDSLAAFRAAQLRGFRWFGVDQGDRQVRLMGTAVGGGDRVREIVKDRIQNRLRMWAYDLTPDRLAAAAAAFDRFRPAFLYGYPSLLYPVAEHLRRHPEHTFQRGLRAVVSTSESLYPHRRRIMEEAYRCPVVNEYGAKELGILAFECPRGGLHVTAEHFLVEVLRGDRPAPPGELGELAVTDLTNRAMPLIRYRLGDLARLSAAPCPCGRALPLLEDLEGAVFGILRTPDGGVVSGIILYYLAEELILEHRSAMSQLRFVQKDLTSLDVLVARGAGFREEVLASVEARLREYLGEGLAFRYEVVDAIPPLLSGKLRLLDSHVPLWSDGVD